MVRGAGWRWCLCALIGLSWLAVGTGSASAHGNPSTWAQLEYRGSSTWKVTSRYMTGSPDHHKLVTRVCLQRRVPGGTRWLRVQADGGCVRNVAYNASIVYAQHRFTVCSRYYRYSYRAVARGWVVNRRGEVSHRSRDVSAVQSRTC